MRPSISILLPFLSLSLFSPLQTIASNITTLEGTWSSGSGAVLTGPGFADPTASTFTYPAVAGWSFSFTGSGYFEQAQFTWVQNGRDPNCVEAVVIWQHGTYTFQPNGSITTDSTVFPSDGRIQVQNACATQSNIISYYSQAGLYAGWTISNWLGNTMLQLQTYDGSLMPRMYLISADPSKYMYPTTNLTDFTQIAANSTSS